MRVAVTGASGYLGRFLVDHLAADPRITSVLALDIAPPARALPGKVEVLTADIHDPDLARALTGCDALCHLAFLVHSRVAPDQAIRLNLDGSRAVLEAARKAGLRRLIVASSIAAYGPRPGGARLTTEDSLDAGPDYTYGHHKALVEGMLDDFETENPRPSIARLRIATVVGPPPRPGDVSRILGFPILALPRGFRMQFIHVDDVAEAFLAALFSELTGAFNIAAEPIMSPAAIAAISGQLALPPPGFILGMLAALCRLFRIQDPGRFRLLRFPILVDCRRSAEELGWEPKSRGDEALRSLFAEPAKA